MITILICAVVGALAVVITLEIIKEYNLYENRTWKKVYESSEIEPAEEKVAGANLTGLTINHIVSVDSVTFQTLTKYAFAKNITVSDTIKEMAKVFPPKSVSIGYIAEIDGKLTNITFNKINCSTSEVGYNPIMGTDKYVYTLNGKEGTMTVDKVLFPDGSPDIIIKCK